MVDTKMMREKFPTAMGMIDAAHLLTLQAIEAMILDCKNEQQTPLDIAVLREENEKLRYELDLARARISHTVRPKRPVAGRSAHPNGLPGSKRTVIPPNFREED